MWVARVDVEEVWLSIPVSDTRVVVGVQACEHLVFLIKVLLNWAAPDVPTWIQNEKRIAALHRTHEEAASAEHQRLPPDESDSSDSSDSNASDTSDSTGGPGAPKDTIVDAETTKCQASADTLLRPLAPAS